MSQKLADIFIRILEKKVLSVFELVQKSKVERIDIKVINEHVVLLSLTSSDTHDC